MSQEDLETVMGGAKMQDRKAWIVLVAGLLSAGLLLAACGGSETQKAEPAEIEAIEGTELVRLTLTKKAVERLDVQTASVEDNGGQLTIPYAAVLYEPNGSTWAYASPESLVFVREPIVVERIDGDVAVLSDGPPPGTEVVTVGVAELWGTELGIE